MSTENKSLSTVPYWDCKTSTVAMYISKLEVMMEYHDSGGSMESTIMATCPAKAVYERFVVGTDAD